MQKRNNARHKCVRYNNAFAVGHYNRNTMTDYNESISSNFILVVLVNFIVTSEHTLCIE